MLFALRTLCVMSFLSLSPVLAQTDQPAPAHTTAAANAGTYKLTFVVREFTAGKLSGSRSYSALFDTSENIGEGRVRAGNRIPVKTGEGSNLQYQYIDAGINFDFRPEKLEAGARAPGTGEIALHIKAEISSAAAGSEGNGTLSGLHASELIPIIRQDLWESGFIIKLNTPTLLFSSEDPTVDRKTQVELTAAKAP